MEVNLGQKRGRKGPCDPEVNVGRGKISLWVGMGPLIRRTAGGTAKLATDTKTGCFLDRGNYPRKNAFPRFHGGTEISYRAVKELLYVTFVFIQIRAESIDIFSDFFFLCGGALNLCELFPELVN